LRTNAPRTHCEKCVPLQSNINRDERLNRFI